MESRGSIPHSQGLSNNPYREPNQFIVWIPNLLRSILILSSNLRLGLPKSLFRVRLPDKILKALLPLPLWLHDLPSESSRLNLRERYKTRSIVIGLFSGTWIIFNRKRSRSC